MVSGNPNVGHFSKKGYDAELLAEEILESQDYEILYNPERMRRKFVNDRKTMDPVIKKQWKNAGDRLNKARKGKNPKKWTQFSKNEKLELEKATKEFYKIDKIHHEELVRINQESHNMRKKKSLAKSIIGDSLMPEINRKEWEKVTGEPIEKSIFNLSFVDLFCKKGNDYYVFDVKHKSFKEKANLNSFTVTNYEVLNYDKISKEDKVKIKIMIILEKKEKAFYEIFDWSDFIVSSTFDPHTMRNTSAKLKNGFDIDKLQKVG